MSLIILMKNCFLLDVKIKTKNDNVDQIFIVRDAGLEMVLILVGDR